MIKFLLPFCIIYFLLQRPAGAQDTDTLPAKTEWEGSATLYGYFMKDDFMMLPVILADNGKLHLEARYNYESEQTFSVWGGYNISGGNKLEYFITPMAGVVLGDINGVAPGLEMTYNIWRIELYTESEYFLDLSDDEESGDFFYNWTDLSFSITDWLWAGVSGQRTRVVASDVEIQRGIFAGGSFRRWELSAYAYNIGSDEPYFIAGLTFSF